MEILNVDEKRIMEKMKELGFPESVTTTVIWATREAPNSTAAIVEVEELLHKNPTGKEMTRAVQKYLR